MIDLAKLREAIGERRGVRSLRDVAPEIGISHQTLNRIERGDMPTLETYALLCKWLEKSLDDFTCNE